jgi:peptidoglycan/LPS O-acetylase OafA/YrhL
MNSKDGKKFNISLEALRGFAAVFVAIAHFVQTNHQTSNWLPLFVQSFEPPGIPCVFVFFTLSGYVIGISNKVALIELDAILAYIKKRITRIYPIYFISLLLTLVVTPHMPSLWIVFCHIILMEGLLSPVLLTNAPMWSLHYEVIYYLIYIPISYIKANVIWVVMGSLTLGIVLCVLRIPRYSPYLSSYSFGFTFWALGLFIAKNIKSIKSSNYPLLLSNIFLLWSMSLLSINERYLNHIVKYIFHYNLEFNLNDNINALTLILFRHLGMLPYSLLFVVNFAELDFRYRKVLSILLQITPLFSLFSLIRDAHTLGDLLSIYGHLFLYVLSCMFLLNIKFFQTLSFFSIKVAAWVGSISYALYIIHHPILMLISGWNIFSNININYLYKLVCFIVVIILFSYLLDKKFQSWIKSKIILVR